jgi:tyrosyl-tRNA synthetase
MNVGDEEAAKCLRIFTTWEQERVEATLAEHARAPHARAAQKALAEEITRRVHGDAELKGAQQASEILFGNATADALASLSDQQWLDVFEGVPQAEVPRDALSATGIIDLLTDRTGFLPSKGEARRALKEGSISVNREKVDEQWQPKADGRFVLLQRGKKNYFLVRVV